MSLPIRRGSIPFCLGLLFGIANAGAWAAESTGKQGGAANVPPTDATPTLEHQLAEQKEGRGLFVRDFSVPDSTFALGGDGIGPMYNDVSCVACHTQGGIGGAGSFSKNVRLLHLLGLQAGPVKKQTLTESARSARQQVHPGFKDHVTTVVLHRHQSERGASSDEYQKWLGLRLPRQLVDTKTLLPLKPELRPQMHFPNGHSNSGDFSGKPYRAAGLAVCLTERNTPSLFGTGLIDSISDAAILAQAERQNKQHGPLISGRVPQSASGAIGRFGWRGQVSSLREFVLAACSVELGLHVPGHPQAEPVIGNETIALRKKNREAKEEESKDRIKRIERHLDQKLDLTQAQCDSLTAYVKRLPAPQTARGSQLESAKSIVRGSALFEKVGCSVCHVPELGPAVGIYSDLLLHDMGSDLSDPSPAMPELKLEMVSTNDGRANHGSAYGGGSFEELIVENFTTNIHQEWRTPPLWGLDLSAPYLHDGRATSLEEAIDWHGGEATRAADAFRSLHREERDDLLRFLRSL